MTAMNAFARDDGAWLLADTGVYDHAGEIVSLESKVEPCDRLRLAIGVSGRLAAGCICDIQAWYANQPDQLTALAGLPQLIETLRKFDAEAVAGGALIGNDLPEGLRLTIALWDRDEGRAKAAIISSIADLGTTPAAIVRPLKTLFSPPLSEDTWPGHSFDPKTDAAALASLQRATTDDRGIHRVGGAFEACHVHAGGIDRAVVCEWRDVVDQPIRLGA